MIDDSIDEKVDLILKLLLVANTSLIIEKTNKQSPLVKSAIVGCLSHGYTKPFMWTQSKKSLSSEDYIDIYVNDRSEIDEEVI